MLRPARTRARTSRAAISMCGVRMQWRISDSTCGGAKHRPSSAALGGAKTGPHGGDDRAGVHQRAGAVPALQLNQAVHADQPVQLGGGAELRSEVGHGVQGVVGARLAELPVADLEERIARDCEPAHRQAVGRGGQPAFLLVRGDRPRNQERARDIQMLGDCPGDDQMPVVHRVERTAEQEDTFHGPFPGAFGATRCRLRVP